MPSKDLTRAKVKKDDDYYTRLEDIQKELNYYESVLKNKIIFCNCNDSEESNFYKYFR